MTVLSIEGVQTPAAHREILQEVTRQVGADTVYVGGTPWWREIRSNPLHMAEQIPFFNVRPLYISIVRAVTRAHIPVIPSLHVVSAVSVIPIGIFTFLMTGDALFSGLLMLTPALILVLRSPLPDALSTAFILAGIWAFMSKRYAVAVAVLLAAIYVRTDNVLIAVAIIAVLVSRKELLPGHAAVLCAVALGSVLFINHYAGHYGWATLMRNSLTPILRPGEQVSHFGIADYFKALFLGLRSAPSVTELAIWLLVGATAVLDRGCTRDEKTLAYVVGGVLLLRFLLFPNPQDRYFVWCYLVAGILLARRAVSWKRSLGAYTTSAVSA